MFGNVAFIICGLCVDILLNLVYFCKKRLGTYETKLYGYLISTNLAGLLIELMCNIAYKYSAPIFVCDFIVKLYLIFLVGWSILFLYYVFIITYDNYKEFREKMISITNISYIFLSFALIFLPVEHFKDGNIIYAKGMAVTMTYFFTGICIFIMLFVMLSNIRKIKSKKYLPLISFVVLATLVSLLQAIYPQLLLITTMETYVMLVMYFTIENPDLKVITELNIAKDQAEKANRAKSDFLSSMSHEIRTPLNAIVGLSEDMKEKDECPENMKEDLEDVVSASRTLLEIVGNIMDISKIESDKMEIIEVPYNFKEEIETLARINAVRIGDKQLELKVNIAEDIPYELVGDRGHVKEIVNNLLSNAIKYTDKGTVNLTVKCINENDICNLMISVEDTGRGIKKENIEKLFTKFERLDVERNTTTEGTGLGLAITKKLVELMGGKINVESEFGKGSIFIVHIPQRIGSMTRPITDTQLINTSEIVKESRKKRVNYKTKSILIVDDNKLNIKVARRSLEQLNFKTIDECYNGKECVDKIKNNEKYDIILMDIMMPIMSGETALEELKKIDGFNTPVIALTADAVAGAEERYKEEGFDGYIAKPFNKDQIKVNLDSLFDNKKKVKELEEDIWKDAPTYIFTSSLAKDDVQNDEQQKEI